MKRYVVLDQCHVAISETNTLNEALKLAKELAAKRGSERFFVYSFERAFQSEPKITEFSPNFDDVESVQAFKEI